MTSMRQKTDLADKRTPSGERVLRAPRFKVDIEIGISISACPTISNLSGG